MIRNGMSSEYSDEGAFGLDPIGLTAQEQVLLEKFRQARVLSAQGHRVAMSVMFYDGNGACDMTIEDRERIPPA